MLYETQTSGSGHALLKLAHVLLDTDEGLNEEQYLALRDFVFEQLGRTPEMCDLFEHVDATDGRFYITGNQ